MGGYGSGEWHTDKRIEVESCVILSTSDLLRDNMFEFGAGERMKMSGLLWSRFGREVYNLSFTLFRLSDGELSFEAWTTNQRISLSSTPMRFGGVRWWFHFPKCESVVRSSTSRLVTFSFAEPATISRTVVAITLSIGLGATP